MSYPTQAPSLTQDEVETMLRQTSFATICTHNKDGSIHAVPVSYMYLDGKIVIVSHASTKKNRNIRRDNRVTVLIDTKKPMRGIMIYGTASLDSDNVLPMVVKMFESSTPEEKVVEVSREFLRMVDSVVLTVTLERIVTFDLEKYDVFREIAEKFNLYWDWP